MNTNQVQQMVYTALSSNADLMAVAIGGVFPLVAPQETPLPFATYNVVKIPTASKDAGLADYNIQINVFANSNSEAVQVLEFVGDAVEDTEFIYQSGDSGVSQEGYYMEKVEYKFLT